MSFHLVFETIPEKMVHCILKDVMKVAGEAFCDIYSKLQRFTLFPVKK